jgi:hypothetical protein
LESLIHLLSTSRHLERIAEVIRRTEADLVAHLGVGSLFSRFRMKPWKGIQSAMSR